MWPIQIQLEVSSFWFFHFQSCLSTDSQLSFLWFLCVTGGITTHKQTNSNVSQNEIFQKWRAFSNQFSMKTKNYIFSLTQIHFDISSEWDSIVSGALLIHRWCQWNIYILVCLWAELYCELYSILFCCSQLQLIHKSVGKSIRLNYTVGK